jgi:hypothetical protein
VVNSEATEGVPSPRGVQRKATKRLRFPFGNATGCSGDRLGMSAATQEENGSQKHHQDYGP